MILFVLFVIVMILFVLFVIVMILFVLFVIVMILFVLFAILTICLLSLPGSPVYLVSPGNTEDTINLQQIHFPVSPVIWLQSETSLQARQLPAIYHVYCISLELPLNIS